MGMACSCEWSFENGMGSAMTSVVEENMSGIRSCNDEVWMEGGKFGG
jgi:hypothetical protein